MWDLSSLTRDRTHIPSNGRQILNHWTTREVPSPTFKNISDHPSFPSSSQPWCMLELPREVLNLWCPGPTPGQTPEAEGLALVLWTFNHSCFDLYFCFCLSLDMCVHVCVCVCVCVCVQFHYHLQIQWRVQLQKWCPFILPSVFPKKKWGHSLTSVQYNRFK